MKRLNLFLIGPTGVGKTTIGRNLASKLNMDFFDSDIEIEKVTGVNISWILDLEGEQGFRKREEKVIQNVAHKNNIVLATGGGSVQSIKVRNCLSSKGIVIYLKSTIEQQISRIKLDKTRPLLRSSDPTKILKAMEIVRNPLYNEIADISIQVNSKSIKCIVNQILVMLNHKLSVT